MARGSKLAAAAATAASAGKRKKGRGRKISKAQKAAAAAAAAKEAAGETEGEAEGEAEAAEEEAKAAEARRARARGANQARTDGSVRRVNLSPDDLAACNEAKLELTVEQVALQEMRARKRGWVCALWVEGQLHVYLAGDLEGDKPWVKKVEGGGKEGEQVCVAKEQLESQRMVVMKEQKFFFVGWSGLLRIRATTRPRRPTGAR